MPTKQKAKGPKPPSFEMRKLMHRLECLIGSECYNGNIQNYGPGGEWEDEGRDFRYPVRFRNSEGQIEKYNGEFPGTKSASGEYTYWALDLALMKSAHYAFGANQLFIFRGLIAALEHIEQRFGLSFEGMLRDEAASKRTKRKHSSQNQQ
ncbi:MAG TPA: hypothetical protein VJH03_11760 [Blastocatellia bacterium]|nr:hypothetical protein [Blastocatellia bacterium]